MAEPKTPNKDKLICGLLFNIEEAHHLAIEKLENIYGNIDYHIKSHIIFNFTNYYDKQMGPNLLRCFISFKELIDPSKLSSIKIQTNEIEKELFIKFSLGRRIINIDPGLLNPSRLVLASAKNYSHRIYLNNGIYAELELLFSKKGAEVLPWTYPDYRTKEYQEVFMEIRKILLQQLKR